MVYTIQKEAQRASRLEITIERLLRPFTKQILNSSQCVLLTYARRGVRLKMGSKGKQDMQRFSATELAKEWIKVYE